MFIQPRQPIPDNTPVADLPPYESGTIEGIQGTFPIYYEIAQMRDSTGNTVPDKIINQVSCINKANVQIPRQNSIPSGLYYIDLRIYNEGHSTILKNILKIKVE